MIIMITIKISQHKHSHAGGAQVLAAEARVFFCKYNDPIYIKLEKLDIMAALASDKTTMAVLAELKEYAQVRLPSRSRFGHRAPPWALYLPSHTRAADVYCSFTAMCYGMFWVD